MSPGQQLRLYDEPLPAHREELAWIAGLFEGEGTVTICARSKDNPYTKVMVSVASTDVDVLEPFQRLWPAKTILKIKARPRCKQAYLWRLECRKAMRFLVEIRSFIKTARVREKIALAIECQLTKRGGGRYMSDEYKAMHLEFKARMRVLNRRGVA